MLVKESSRIIFKIVKEAMISFIFGASCLLALGLQLFSRFVPLQMSCCVVLDL